MYPPQTLVPMSVGSTREAQHLKWAYYQLLYIALHRNGVLVSGNSVGKQCCTSPALLGWVVW